MAENKFSNLPIESQPLPGVNKFSNLLTTGESGNRFDNLDQSPINDAIKITQKSFGGTIGAIGRILNIGQYAQVGITEQALEKTGILQPTGIKGTGVQAGIKQEKSNIELLRRIGQETGKGGLLTGQYTPSVSVFGNFIKEIPVTVTGLAGDIFLDPTTYVGGGLIKRTATGFGLFGKLLVKEVPIIAKAVEIVKPAVQVVGETLGKVFITRYGQRPEFKTADIKRKIEESLAQETVGKLVDNVIEKPAVIQQRITQVIKGDITNDKELNALALPIRQELDRVGESISKLNPKLLSPETFATNKGTYFPRLYTKHEFPTDEQAILNAFSFRAVSIPKARFKQRILTEAESQATPSLIREAGLPSLKGLTQLNIVEQRQKFFNEINKLAGDSPKPGWIQLADDKSLGKLSGKFLPSSEYTAIAQLRRIPTEGEQIYNNALTLWKAFKTAYNPATISRNALTNFFVLNPLGTVGPHRLDIYAKTIHELTSQGAMYQLARQQGLNISTQQAAELTNKATRFYTANKTWISPFFGTVKQFHNAVSNFYGSQDKFFKLANFIKGVTEDGMTPYQAMNRANFYLIDYSEVPQFIDWLRKSPVGIPFISFTYGVTKPLAKTLLENPQRLAVYFKILSAIQQMNPTGETKQDIQDELGILPEWIHEGTYLRLPVKDQYQRGQYVNLQYILPFNILESKSILPSSPVLTILSSLLQNRDTFYNRDIYLTSDTSAEKVKKMTFFLYQQLVPSFAPGGTSYTKVKAYLEKRPDKAGFVRQGSQVMLDVLGGIKITPIDKTLEAQKRVFEKRREIEELKNQIRRIVLDKTLTEGEKQLQTIPIHEKIRNVFKSNQQSLQSESLPPN